MIRVGQTGCGYFGQMLLHVVITLREIFGEILVYSQYTNLVGCKEPFVGETWNVDHGAQQELLVLAKHRHQSCNKNSSISYNIHIQIFYIEYFCKYSILPNAELRLAASNRGILFVSEPSLVYLVAYQLSAVYVEPAMPQREHQYNV